MGSITDLLKNTANSEQQSPHSGVNILRTTFQEPDEKELVGDGLGLNIHGYELLQKKIKKRI